MMRKADPRFGRGITNQPAGAPSERMSAAWPSSLELFSVQDFELHSPGVKLERRCSSGTAMYSKVDVRIHRALQWRTGVSAPNEIPGPVARCCMDSGQSFELDPTPQGPSRLITAPEASGSRQVEQSIGQPAKAPLRFRLSVPFAAVAARSDLRHWLGPVNHGAAQSASHLMSQRNTASGRRQARLRTPGIRNLSLGNAGVPEPFVEASPIKPLGRDLASPELAKTDPISSAALPDVTAPFRRRPEQSTKGPLTVEGGWSAIRSYQVP